MRTAAIGIGQLVALPNRHVKLIDVDIGPLEVHTLGIGTGNARASRTGPGPNIDPNPLPYFLQDQYPLR